jgi:hypothetical protein
MMKKYTRCQNLNHLDKIEESISTDFKTMQESIKSCLQPIGHKVQKMKGLIKQQETELIASQQMAVYHKEIIRRTRYFFATLQDNQCDSCFKKTNTNNTLGDMRDFQFAYKKALSCNVNSIIQESLLCYLDEIEKSSITVFKKLSKNIPLLHQDDLMVRHLLLSIINYATLNTFSYGTLNVLTSLSEKKDCVYICIEYSGCLDENDFVHYNKKNDDPVDNFYSSPDKIIKKAHLYGYACRHEKINKAQKSYMFTVEIPIETMNEYPKDSNVVNLFHH